MRKSIKKIISIVLCLGLGAGALAGCTTTQPTIKECVQEITQDDLSTEYLKGQAQGQTITETITTDCPVVAPLDCPVLEDAEEIQCAVDRETEAGGYYLENLEIGAEFSCVVLTDKNINLFDGEVRFDGEDIDADEAITICGTIGANEEDYKGATFLQLKEGDISYVYEFSDELDTDDINEDETLEFTFLEEDYEIIKWSGDKITLFKGVTDTIKEGESIAIGDKTLTANAIGDGSAMLTIGSESMIVDKGETHTIDGVQIEIISILDTDTPNGDMLEFRAGEDIELEIEDGDEYAEDSIWDYTVGDNQIGITLNTEFKYLDEDEAALAFGESITLPNGIDITYTGLTSEDTVEVKLDKKDKRGTQYTRVKADLVIGKEDYNMIYILGDKIYDDDLELIATGSIDIEDTEMDIVATADEIIIGGIVMSADLKGIKIDGNEASGFDETYVSDYGMTIPDPDKATDDQKIEIFIPEEQLFADITVTSK